MHDALGDVLRHTDPAGRDGKLGVDVVDDRVEHPAGHESQDLASYRNPEVVRGDIDVVFCHGSVHGDQDSQWADSGGCGCGCGGGDGVGGDGGGGGGLGL